MLILLQPDLEKAIEFYKKLGLKLKFHLKDSWAEFVVGDVKIGLCPTSGSPTQNVTGIVLQTDDLMALYNQFKDTVPFRSEPVEKVHGIMVGFEDPGGNIIDLYQPTPDKVQDLIKKSDDDAGSEH